MYEHNYCQHKALKPADFKLNGAVLWCPASFRRLTGTQCGRSVPQLGLVWQPFHSAPAATHIYLPAHTLTLMHTESLGSNLSFFFLTCLKRKKKKVWIIMILEEKAREKKKRRIPISTSREAIWTCFFGKSLTFIVHVSIQLVFAVLCNS